MNSFFDINRLFLVIRREAIINSRIYLSSTAFIFGAFFLVYFFATLFGAMIPYGVEEKLYYIFLIVGGAIFTSQAFTDIKRPIGYFYIMLPASAFEKVLSKWFITLLGWFFAYTLSFNLVSMFGHGIFSAAHGTNFTYQFIVPFAGSGFDNLSDLLFIHAVFLLGAAIFRRRAFLYTFLSLTGFIILMTIAIIAVFFIWYDQADIRNILENFQFSISFEHADFYITLFLTLVFYFLTYIRIRKTEL